MKNLEDLFKKLLVYLGDLHRMELRLSDFAKEAHLLGVDIEDLPEAEKTIKRLKKEANILHDKVNNKLDGE